MKNKWVVLGAGIAIQVILGGIYAWSTFVPYLVEGYSLTKEQCGFIFGLTIGVFALVMNLAGWVLNKKGPRFTAGIGGVLFLTGYFLSSMSKGDYHTLLLTIGGISGAGIGFGYVCPLAVGMKWFPRKKGLITGVAVAGFGGGAVLLSSVAQYYLEGGMDVLEFFKWFGLSSGVILIISTFFLAEPEAEKAVSTDVASLDGVWTAPFLVMFICMFAGTFAGLLVVGNLSPIVIESGLTAHQAVLAISLFSIGNALGRVTWGYAVDTLHYRSIPLSLAFFAVLMLVLSVAKSSVVCYLVSGLMGFAFGGNFVIYAAAVSRFFGTVSFTRLYPVCFLGYGLAGLVGPGIGGRLADGTGSYQMALYISFGILAVAAVISGLGQKVFEAKEAVQSS